MAMELHVIRMRKPSANMVLRRIKQADIATITPKTNIRKDWCGGFPNRGDFVAIFLECA